MGDSESTDSTEEPYFVDESVLKRTTGCEKGFACQKPGWAPCGEIKRLVTDRLLEGMGSLDSCMECGYSLQYGKGMYCRCPVRIEIYKRYRK